MTTPKLSGKKADTKGRYVRISNAAYLKVKKHAEKNQRSFITTADILLGV